MHEERTEDSTKQGQSGGTNLGDTGVMPRDEPIRKISFYTKPVENYLTGFDLHENDYRVSRRPTNPGQQDHASFELEKGEYITNVIFYYPDTTASGVELFTKNGRQASFGDIRGTQSVHEGAQLAGFAGNIGWKFDKVWCVWENQPLAEQTEDESTKSPSDKAPQEKTEKDYEEDKQRVFEKLEYKQEPEGEPIRVHDTPAFGSYFGGADQECFIAEMPRGNTISHITMLKNLSVEDNDYPHYYFSGIYFDSRAYPELIGQYYRKAADLESVPNEHYGKRIDTVEIHTTRNKFVSDHEYVCGITFGGVHLNATNGEIESETKTYTYTGYKLVGMAGVMGKACDMLWPIWEKELEGQNSLDYVDVI